MSTRLQSFAAAICLSSLLLISCRPETFVPKPRGYYKVSFPQHRYRLFEEAGFPYSFEYPVYGNVVHDTVFFDTKPENPYWLNVDFPGQGGQFFITYKRIGPGQPLDKLVEDAFKMSYFHNKRADFITDNRFTTPNGVSGTFYHVGGNAATNYQFFATDSVRHFLWVSLYFNATPNADSLGPVNDFLKKDMEHMLQSLRWSKEGTQK